MCIRDSQVVVVLAPGAPAVDRLAVGGAQRIHLAAVCQRLQRPVDGGQPDLLPAFAQQLVQVLGRAEVVDLREQLSDGGALPGHPLHHRASSEVSTTSSATSGCGSRVPLRRACTTSGRTAATSAYRPMARTTIAIAVSMVRRKDEVTSCATATGTIISALTRSTPTTRIATVTVSALM